MRKLVLSVTVSVVLLGLAAGGWFAWIQLGDPHHRSEAMVQLYGQPTSDAVFPDEQRSPVLIEEVSVGAMMREARHQAELIRSPTMMRKAIQWPSVRETDWFASYDGDVRLAASDLIDRTEVAPVPDSTLIRVAVALPDPQEAQAVLDAILTVYLQERQIEAENRITRWSAGLNRERERADEELRRLELERDRFIHENDMATLEPTGPDLPWIAKKVLETRLEIALLTDGSEEPEKSEESEESEELRRAQIALDHWLDTQRTVHAKTKDELRQLQMLGAIEVEMDRVHRRRDIVDDRLADLRNASVTGRFTLASRAVLPSEPELELWRWPWD
ncbi:MAG: hypothetical protein AAGF84_05080 [Planctomycetota bacterium]